MLLHLHISWKCNRIQLYKSSKIFRKFNIFKSETCCQWGTWKSLWKNMNWNKKFIKKMEQKILSQNLIRSGKDMYPMLKEAVENKIDTLDILFNFNCFILNKYCVCPKKSLTILDLMVLNSLQKRR